MRRNKWIGLLFTQCEYCDVLFWMLIGSAIGALGMWIICWGVTHV